MYSIVFWSIWTRLTCFFKSNCRGNIISHASHLCIMILVEWALLTWFSSCAWFLHNFEHISHFISFSLWFSEMCFFYFLCSTNAFLTIFATLHGYFKTLNFQSRNNTNSKYQLLQGFDCKRFGEKSVLQANWHLIMIFDY